MAIKNSKGEPRIMFPSSVTTPAGWPEPLDVGVMQGPVGDIVNTIGPHTEADPAALAIGAINAFGNVVGPKPHFTVNRTRHAVNLYTVFVGRSAKARKGSACDEITNLFGQVDPEWVQKAHLSGLVSGEGLVAAAAGGADKRVVFYEDEFAGVLKVMARHRNTLSTMLRLAWDGRPLRVATKRDAMVVTGSHIGLVGQTTIEDLLRHIDVTEISNGLANRILWPCVSRRQLLPFGGNVPDEELRRIVMRLKDAVAFSRGCDEVEFSEKAARLWTKVYPELTADVPGLVGAATSRAEAQTRRIATIYALMDGVGEVRLQHLRAAVGVWRFCRDSARFIFGRRQRKTTGELILGMLLRSKNGLSRSEISKGFSHHRDRDEIDDALSSLKESGRAEPQRVPTGGRFAERWVATPEKR